MRSSKDTSYKLTPAGDVVFVGIFIMAEKN
jgi:hypothetical protein